jgi:large subunit ribosomal protein L30e
MARKKKAKITSTNVDLSRKKKKEFDIDTNIKVALRSGELVYGKNQVLKKMRQKPYKMLIMANNAPVDLQYQIEHYNSLLEDKEKIFIHTYKGSSWDLGLACAKPYMISVIGIYDYGDSDLQSLRNK